MKLTYYTLMARLVPDWKLPDAKALKLEAGQLKGVTGTLPVDPKKWTDPPHVVLANLGYGGYARDEQIEMFTARYGLLSIVQGPGAQQGPEAAEFKRRIAQEFDEGNTPEQIEKIPGLLAAAAEQVIASIRPGKPFWLSLDSFRLMQAQLREAWRQANTCLFTDPRGVTESFGYDMRPITWGVKRHGLEIRPASCFDYVGLLLARDIAEGSAKICQNPDCASPYFVARRSDAKFCSHPCAVAVNVKNFRQRAKRKRKR